jgi:hypothetical protein
MLRLDQRPTDKSGLESAQTSALSVLIITTILAAGLAVSAYAYIGYSTRFWADDYCISAHMNARGLWRAQEYWWSSWTGRFAYIFFTDVWARIGPGVARFFTPGLLVLWFAGLVWAMSGFTRLVAGRRQIVFSFLLAALVLFAFLRTIPDPQASLYWLTGSSNYSVPLVIFTFYVAFLGHTLHSQPDLIDIPISFAFAFVGAGFAETFAVWQTAVLALSLVGCRFLAPDEVRRKLQPLLIAGLAGSLIAVAIVGSAPGNDRRQATEGPKMPLPEVAQASFVDAASFITHALSRPEILLAGGVSALAGMLLLRERNDASKLKVAGLLVRLGAIFAIAYALVLVVHIPAMYFLNEAAPKRVLGVAMLTCIIAVMYAGYTVGRLLAEGLPLGASGTDRGQQIAFAAVLGLTLVSMSAFAGRDAVARFKDGRDLSRYAAAWDRRDMEIRQAKESGQLQLTVRLLPHPSALELTPDTSIWINQCAASYYGVQTIHAQSD